MGANDYLKKHHNTWQVVVNVPPKLRKLAGVTRFKKSLGTSNLTEANRLKHSYVAEFKRQIEVMKKGAPDPDAALYRDAGEWRGALKQTSNATQEQDGREFNERDELLSIIKDQARQIEELRGPTVALRFLKAASGEGTFIKDHYPTWVSESDVAGQTRSQHTSTLKRFLEWAGEFATIEETDRVKAGEYVGHLLASSGLSRRTVKRHLSSLSQLWEWLNSRGLAGENVWLRHKLGKKTKATTRIGLTDELVLKLLNGRSRSKKFDQLLADLLRLALLTGARLDELCAVKRSEVHKREDGYWITVSDGKTDAAVRDIPLHEAATPIIERRLKDKDEYLFAGLIPGGPDDKRSWYVSKAYSRFRGQVGVDGKWQDFHALRNTFISMMEGLEIPESTVKLIVGHKRVSMTYGHYSKGKRVELRGVIDRLDYGAEIMKAIRS